MNNSSVTFQNQSGLTIVTFAGPITDTALDQFERTVPGVLEKDSRYVVLDLLDVNYLYSRAIGSFLRLYRDAVIKNKEIVIINATDSILDILRVTKVSRVMPVFNSLEQFFEWGKDMPKVARAAPACPFVLREKNGVTVVALVGDIEEISGLDIGKIFLQVESKIVSSKAVIDFTNIVALDSTGISALVRIGQKMQNRGGVLVLSNVNAVVKELLELLCVENLFTLVDSVVDGINFLSRQAG